MSPATSVKQRRFMGMVHAAQKGELEHPSAEVEKAAGSMTQKQSKDFASTKEGGLPMKKKSRTGMFAKYAAKKNAGVEV